MALIGESNLTAAHKLFETLTESVFGARQASGATSRISRTYQGAGSTAIEVVLPGSVPAFKRWTDERDFGGTRFYKRTMAIQTQANGMTMQRKQLEYDQSGAVGQAVDALLSDTAYLEDKLVLDVIDDNGTGFDGVALVGSTHPHGAAGATWDNSTANALSFSAWDTAVAFGKNLQDEHSEYVDVQYDTLIVPPASRRIALEIAQADARPVAVATDSTIDSGGIGATGLPNVYRGTMTVIESPRITAGTWYAIDSRRPPVALCTWSGFRAVMSDALDGDERMRTDTIKMGVERDIAAYGLDPWGIYGNPA